MHAYQGSIIPGQVELSPNITLRFKVISNRKWVSSHPVYILKHNPRDQTAFIQYRYWYRCDQDYQWCLIR